MYSLYICEPGCFRAKLSAAELIRETWGARIEVRGLGRAGRVTGRDWWWRETFRGEDRNEDRERDLNRDGVEDWDWDRVLVRGHSSEEGGACGVQASGLGNPMLLTGVADEDRVTEGSGLVTRRLEKTQNQGNY